MQKQVQAKCAIHNEPVVALCFEIACSQKINCYKCIIKNHRSCESITLIEDIDSNPEILLSLNFIKSQLNLDFEAIDNRETKEIYNDISSFFTNFRDEILLKIEEVEKNCLSLLGHDEERNSVLETISEVFNLRKMRSVLNENDFEDINLQLQSLAIFNENRTEILGSCRSLLNKYYRNKIKSNFLDELDKKKHKVVEFMVKMFDRPILGQNLCFNENLKSQNFTFEDDFKILINTIRKDGFCAIGEPMLPNTGVYFTKIVTTGLESDTTFNIGMTETSELKSGSWRETRISACLNTCTTNRMTILKKGLEKQLNEKEVEIVYDSDKLKLSIVYKGEVWATGTTNNTSYHFIVCPYTDTHKTIIE